MKSNKYTPPLFIVAALAGIMFYAGCAAPDPSVSRILRDDRISNLEIRVWTIVESTYNTAIRSLRLGDFNEELLEDREYRFFVFSEIRYSMIYDEMDRLSSDNHLGESDRAWVRELRDIARELVLGSRALRESQSPNAKEVKREMAQAEERLTRVLERRNPRAEFSFIQMSRDRAEERWRSHLGLYEKYFVIP
jgi:hypothetical protein